jgi:uncharacterized protein (TIGR03435 family)
MANGCRRYSEVRVSSVKQNKSGLPPSGDQPHSNVVLSEFNVFAPTGGLFSAKNFTPINYISFAYKLTFYDMNFSLPTRLPKWAQTDRYDIEAKAAGNPTKDQYRLMMQALLAERFKLAIHWETRQLPVLALVLDKPGKLGPQLRPYVDDPPCVPFGADSGTSDTIFVNGLSRLCGGVQGELASGHAHLGARDVNMDEVASILSVEGGEADMGRPMVDRTGLSGKFDFSIEYTPDWQKPPNPTFQPDPLGPTLVEALKNQLGLKLVPQTGPVDVLVIDHIEEPSPN